MIPAIGPSSAEYPTSQSKMYVSALASSFHGMMRMPSTPVITPPILNEMCRGAKLAKSLAGLMTFAAMLVLMVATATPNRLSTATTMRVPSLAKSGASRPAGALELVICASTTTGSHSVFGSLPFRMVSAALVMITAIMLKAIMVVGRPNT